VSFGDPDHAGRGGRVAFQTPNVAVRGAPLTEL